VTDREVLAFDLYGTLVDPIAVSSELDLVLGGSDGAEVARFFGQRISADEVRVFKPSPTVYLHAAERLAVPIGRIRLVTCNAFDSVGASAAGMRTAWVNRSAAPFDTIGTQPDLTVPALGRLPAALRR
jgi:2-haloacid dehalogenase